MKRFMPVFVFLLLLFSTVSLHAQRVRWGGRVGFTDGDPMIGGDMLVPITSRLMFNPNLEISTDLVTTNADVHYDFDLTREAAAWFGAGIALINPEGQDLDVGVNALAGVGTRWQRHIVYAQFKVTAPGSYDGYTSLAVGIRF
jgi:hypothetical protein